MTGTATADVYYDPYDFEIDTDPYPIWKRLRDEAPLYYNEKYDFYALSRFDDVEQAFVDWKSFISSRGTVLEMIKRGMQMPAGSIISEDPPTHDIHRGILSRAFTPRRVSAIEPKVREFCATKLEPFLGSEGFDIVRDFGVYVPMRTIGMLLGIPDEDQERIRDLVDQTLRLEDGTMPDDPRRTDIRSQTRAAFAEYIDWRAKHPSDDIMTEVLQAEFEDSESGERRKLTKDEVVSYVNLLAGAGNETTARLIGWAGIALGSNPDQRRELVERRELVPNAIEELLRFETPSPVQARWVAADVERHGRTIPKDSILLLLNGAANRDDRKFADPDRFDIHRKMDHHLAFGYGIHFCLGAALARLEGRVALDEILKRFPNWDVDWDNAVQGRTSTVRGWQRLPIVTS